MRSTPIWSTASSRFRWRIASTSSADTWIGCRVTGRNSPRSIALCTPHVDIPSLFAAARTDNGGTDGSWSNTICCSSWLATRKDATTSTYLDRSGAGMMVANQALPSEQCRPGACP
ncbi:hypothetical protein [Streptomyces europaeiscabiei]|uniref:hypothetical protein n=1 Tax=Streptomyces europaeiscabiei TaxID=146819 RepID=UPI0029BFCDE9|nr:hypothetical protein [Streptomyces europaeiscabiei]